MITLNDAVIEEIEKVREVSQYIWQREWAERNGGNISVDVTDIIGDVDAESSEQPLPMAMPSSCAGRIYYVKGTGQRIRELREPDYAGCILQINQTADGFAILWGGKAAQNFAPTSEFISHIKILEAKRATGSADKAVVHTHP